MNNLFRVFIVLLIGCHVQNSFASTPLVEFISTPTASQTVKSQNTNLIFYTIRNNTYATLPLSYTFSNNAASVFGAGSTCGNAITGKSTCVLAVQYQAPAGNKTDNVIVYVNFQGRAPLTSSVTFNVSNDIACVLLNTASWQSPFCQQQYQNVLQLTPSVFNLTNTNVMNDQTLGGVFGIYQHINNGEQICYISCGLKSLNGVAPDENTLFELASVTKTLTTSILGKLLYNGTISSALDPIRFSLPPGFALHANENPVTWQQLATFSGGVCFSDAPSVVQNSGNQIQNQNDFVLNINALNPDPASGNCVGGSTPNVTQEYATPPWLPTHNFYSNSSVGLLGQGLMAIQGFNVYEDGFNNWICENISNVLEMKNSSACLPSQTAPCAASASNCTFASSWPSSQYASGYHLNNGTYQQGNAFPFLPWAPAGGIRSNAVDMVKFLRANLGFSTNGSVAQAELIEGMRIAHQANNYLPAPNGVMPKLNIGSQSPLRGGQGFAWVCEPSPTNGDTICGKIGGHENFRSFLGFNANKNYGVIILFNTGSITTDGSIAVMDAAPSIGTIGTDMLESAS